MKVLILNGSPRSNGNSAILIKEMKGVFDEFNVGYKEAQIGKENVRGCLV